ncbi:UvrD-helicase domain-containing protein [Alteribacter aurantiacus]|uniref:UvrD-helicase domain-containing protein n=1 Tax=Alteribacter aurantiacus TaxID=254410 RepID=UPI00040B1F73|nr:UvrD-helicase domain-containing protein [Alteribacter aurantiacus]
MTNLIDQHQRDLINHDLDRNFLVEAGAGSGKTRSLVTRMTNLIVSGKYQIHEIVAITFTRKAADELKERFQASLEQTANEPSENLEKERVVKALEHFDQCFLGTVHSFCSKLLRERPVEAGLDFDFKELDDVEDDKLLDQAWERHLITTRLHEPEKLTEFHGIGIDVKELRNALKTVKDYEDVKWFTKGKDKPDIEHVFKELVHLIEYAKRSLPDQKPPKGYDALQKKLREVMKVLSYYDMAQERNKIAMFKLFSSKLTIVQNRWSSKDDAKDILEKAQSFQELAKTFLDEWAEYCHQLIIPFIRPALSAYKELKADLSQLNFQDLLLLTAKLLRDNPDIRRYFKNKYRCLLVDEFQDTDPVQAEMMLFLTGDQVEERDWTKQVPKPGSLFVVGDPKQSIYRFRRADIDIYQKVKEMISQTGGETLDLVMNFRTTSRITERINPVFKEALPEKENSYQAAYRPLVSYKQDQEDEDMLGIYSLTVPDGNKGTVMDEEAHRIAAYISDKVNRGIANPSDFMILTRYNEGVSEYTKVLQKFNLPVMTSGEFTLDQDRLLSSFSHLLMYIAKPSSSFYFTAVLRGPFFGISDELLFKFKEEGGSFHAYSKIPNTLTGEEQQLLVYAFEKIRRYLKWSKEKIPTATISLIAEDVCLLGKYMMDKRTKREVVHYYQIVEKVRDKEMQGSILFGDSARAFAELVTESTHEEMLLPEDAQAVRVMNVHKSKGLEAPYVFLVHPKKWTDAGKFVDKHIQRSSSGSIGYFTFNRAIGPHNRKERMAQPIGWEEKHAEETTYLKAEEDRLLYVAATRAERMLVVGRTDKEKNTANPWTSLHNGITQLKELELPESFEAPALHDNIKEVIPYDLFASFKKEKADWLVHAKKETFTYATPSKKEANGLELERSAGGGKEWGSFVHDLFEERIKHGQQALDKIPHLLKKYSIDSKREGEARELVDDFAKSTLFSRISQADHVLTEVPFTYQENATIHNGIIDLVFKEGAEWVIVDYKTDRLKKEEDLSDLTKIYESQLDSYVEAWTRLTKESVKEATLHFVYYQ